MGDGARGQAVGSGEKAARKTRQRRRARGGATATIDAATASTTAAAAVAGIPGFLFATIPDGLPESDADATMTTCLPHFRKLLADLNNRAASDDDDDAVPPVTCVVADHLLGFSLDAPARAAAATAHLHAAHHPPAATPRPPPAAAVLRHANSHTTNIPKMACR